METEMTRLALRFAAAILIFVGFFAGCDPTRTTEQIVSIQVIDLESKSPLQNSPVALKVDFKKTGFERRKQSRSKDEWQEFDRKYWESSPWWHGTTDSKGHVQITIGHTMIDRNRSSIPPTDANVVAGTMYLVKVVLPDGREEQLSVEMKPGEMVEGMILSIIVNEVTLPTYVENAEQAE